MEHGMKNFHEAWNDSIIALGNCDEKPDYDYGDHAEIRVYSLIDGVETSSVLAFMKKIQMLIPCLVLIVPVALVLIVFIIGAIKDR